MNVGDILPSSPELLDRPALSVEGENPLTYRQLHERRDRYANALLASNIGPQDRVGVMLRNCVDYWPIHLAIGLIGAITVRINFRLSREELAYVLDDSQCSILLIHDTVLDGFESLPLPATVKDVVVLHEEEKTDVPTGTRDVEQWLDVAPRELEHIDVRPNSPHMIMYTSGTTGKPKGAVWTHQSTVMFGSIQLMQWGDSPDRVALTVGPLYHVGSMEDVLLPTLMSGGHAVMMKSGQFHLRRALDLIASLRVTNALLFPAMVYSLLEVSDENEVDLSSLVTLLTGGSPLLESAVAKFNERFPNVDLWSVYGLTEGGGISTALGPEEGRRLPAAAGRPLPLVSIRIESDENVEVPTGEVGEICISGPNTAIAYWRRDEETAQTFVDGWVHTGDLGYLDTDGILTVTGRAKDMIRSGDENIYAAEVERVLALHPSIVESAVVGVPDQKYGEAVCAVLVLRFGMSLTVNDVIELCLAHLASYKKPRFIAVIDELPRNATAKVVKDPLRAMLREGQLTVLSSDTDADLQSASRR